MSGVTAPTRCSRRNKYLLFGTSAPTKKTKATKPVKRVFAITTDRARTRSPSPASGTPGSGRTEPTSRRSRWSTTEPNELVAQIHDRLALILHPRDYNRWLGIDARGGDPRPPLDLLHPYDADKMVMKPANPAVGNWRNNGPEMLDPT